MLEMLKARKEQLEARGQKGFTLMEMLIVIAIIAVLIAIAIPVFGSQLDNANKATAQANGRSLYAILMADYMEDSKIDATIGDAAVSSMNAKDQSGDLTVTVGSSTQKITIPNGYSLKVTGTGMPVVQVLKGTDVIETFGGTTS